MWHGEDLRKLTLLRGPDSTLLRVGDKVTLKSPPSELLLTYGKPLSESPVETITVDSFVVSESITTVTLLWQDGQQERANSVDLLPYLNPDEYDCWYDTFRLSHIHLTPIPRPGDHVLWKTEDSKLPAVIQRVNAIERTAEILLYDGQRELVSVLELDPHGSHSQLENPHETFGVRRAELVFIHGEDSTNGCQMPVVPLVGELESWALDQPLLHFHGGEYCGWRKELDTLGQSIAQTGSIYYFSLTAATSASNIEWFGEVLDVSSLATSYTEYGR